MPARPRRRAVGPRGSAPAASEQLSPGRAGADLGLADLGLSDGTADNDLDRDAQAADDERLRADRPPHHDRGV